MDTKNSILYIDDEEINVQLFHINFSKKYNVHTGLSGYEGLELLSNYPDIKVVISDMKMPEMNGLEFISLAKEKHQSIKFFILTGYDITDEIQTAINKGLILKYFRKPFNMKEIDEAINKAL